MNQNYQFFIIKSEKVGLKHYNVLKAFTDYSNHIQDVYKSIDEYNPGKESINRTWSYIIGNKRLNLIVTELWIRGWKLNISLVFMTQSYFKVLKDVRLNSTYYFIMNIPYKRGPQ